MNVHVKASARQVIRKARQRIAKHHRRSRQHREARHVYFRAMLDQHQQARGIVNAFRL
jgi:hypothetical protein